MSNPSINPSFGMAPVFDSSWYFTAPTPTQVPNYNDYSAEVVQAVYQDDMWESGQQSLDFAGRCILMAGTSSAALANLTSGDELTRVDPSNYTQIKYLLGSISCAQYLRGFSWYDHANAIGATNFASTAFHNGLSYEANAPQEEPYIQYHVTDVIGSENIAMIGRRISEETIDNKLAGPVDGRLQAHKNDDVYALLPAIAKIMIGAQGTVWLDTKKTTSVVPGWENDPVPYAGAVGLAYGLRANVLGLVKGGWINVGKAVGVQSNFMVVDGLAGCDDNCEGREGSTVRTYRGFEANYPNLGSSPECPINLLSATGVWVWDQNPGAGGGSPPENAILADPWLEGKDIAKTPEKRAAIIARGDVVVGDGQNPAGESGFDTDVLHVRDLIHLSPRTEPPRFDQKVPPSDRVGLVYFDAAKNSLRVSVAAQGEGAAAEDWHNAEVAWVDIGLALDRIDPVRDVRGSTAKEGTLASATAADVRTAIERAKTAAVTCTSPYLARTVAALTGSLGGAARGPTEGGPTVTLLLSGFNNRTPRVFWRRVPYGVHNAAGTQWTEIPPGALAPVEGLVYGSAVSATVDFVAPGPDGQPGIPGQAVQILAVDPVTGQSTGTAFEIPRG